MTHCQLKMEGIDGFVMKLSLFLANVWLLQHTYMQCYFVHNQICSYNVHLAISRATLYCAAQTQNLRAISIPLLVCQCTLAQIYIYIFHSEFPFSCVILHTHGQNGRQSSGEFGPRYPVYDQFAY